LALSRRPQPVPLIRTRRRGLCERVPQALYYTAVGAAKSNNVAAAVCVTNAVVTNAGNILNHRRALAFAHAFALHAVAVAASSAGMAAVSSTQA